METSDFGKGFIYNLILFASHFEKEMILIKDIKDYALWFDGASDHLYELEIPEKWKDHEIGKKAKELQDLSLEIGHGKRMWDKNCEEDFKKVVKLTKEIGFLIDKELGFNPIKGKWE